MLLKYFLITFQIEEESSEIIAIVTGIISQTQIAWQLT